MRPPDAVDPGSVLIDAVRVRELIAVLRACEDGGAAPVVEPSRSQIGERLVNDADERDGRKKRPLPPAGRSPGPVYGNLPGIRRAALHPGRRADR